ncbi:hypothetical protein GCK32_001601 [Trichostrongylus colubriformis]|uniref:EB domain-containing protein n=1 Tax=Trichostrongylus colubriformis TaxID=6319 RepID=A0AAN8ITJ9_TRICO
MQYPAQLYHPSQPGYPVAQSAMPHPSPQQIPGYYPPHPQHGLPPTQPQQPPDGYVTATEHTTTTTQQRLYDQQPYVAYPGGFCRIPEIVCVGGSSCENNVCVCRRGEEPVNGQCQRIEVSSIFIPF